MSQFEGLVSDVRRLNEARARRKEAERANLIRSGEDLVFNTLLECLPDGHPMQQQAVRDHIAHLGRVAHSEGRAPGPVDSGAILSELKEKHRSHVRRATEELEDQQPTERGVIFKHWELRVNRERMRLSNSVKTLEGAQQVRLRAAQLVRETKFNESVDAPAAVRRAMGGR